MTTHEVRSEFANLRRLATLDLPGPYVTLVVPPVRGTAGRQAIDEVGGSLIRDARRQLTDDPWSMSDQGAERLLSQASEQLRDASRSETDGLVILVADDYVDAHAVRGPITADHVVAARPDLALLAEAAAATHPFHLLVLSQHRVEVHHCTGPTVTRMTDLDLPSGLGDTGWLAGRPVDVSLHGGPVHAGTDATAAHGGPAAKDLRKSDLERFIAAIDRALPSPIHDGPPPLVVVAVAYEAAMLRDARPHRDLVLLTELGSPERLSVETMCEAAKRRLEPRTTSELAGHVDRYRTWAGTGRTSAGLDLVATDAREGRVEVLLIDVERRSTAVPDVRARLAEVVADVIARSGTVRLVPRDITPASIDDLAVAILRY